ncbi:unnamed protein product [Sphagnum jensenii]|uniref:Uncharacterized protein n=1 Tax=Sphagnum jensenii TaxID=128206 RepID=A0ABP0WGX7_9BRYO
MITSLLLVMVQSFMKEVWSRCSILEYVSTTPLALYIEMQQWSGNLVMQNGEGGVFDLPQEVLSISPSDPYEQLDVAHTITAMAIVAHVSKLELEIKNLHLKLVEKENIIHVL